MEFQAREQHVQNHETIIVHGVLGKTSSILVLLLKYEEWMGRK